MLNETTFSYSDTEHRLIHDLLHGYNKYAHPKSYIERENVNFTVVFGIEIVQLVDVVRYKNRNVTDGSFGQKCS
jgi:hypothetical protein